MCVSGVVWQRKRGRKARGKTQNRGRSDGRRAGNERVDESELRHARTGTVGGWVGR